MAKAKKWYTSKTYYIGALEILIGIGGLVATFLEAGDFAAPAIVCLVTGVLTIVLRKLTKEPV